MATIEERANEYAEEMVAEYKEPRAINAGLAKFKEQYIHIATEQRTIDIDKACEWLRWIMENGSSYRVFPNKQSIEDFRKAMEE